MKSAWFGVFLLGCGPTYLDAAGLAPTTLGSGLVAHWQFDEMDGLVVADDSGNRRDGTISGATFTSDGRFGGALQGLELARGGLHIRRLGWLACQPGERA